MTSKFAGLELEVAKPLRMTLIDPGTKESIIDSVSKEEAYIEVMSGDSDVAQKLQRNIQQRRLDKLRMSGRKAKIKAEDMEREGVDLLVAVTTGWRLVDLGGNAIDVPFSADNARELYSTPALAWIKEQVDEFVGDRGNFSKASSTS